jgi:hypothetical protein
VETAVLVVLMPLTVHLEFSLEAEVGVVRQVTLVQALTVALMFMFGQ